MKHLYACVGLGLWLISISAVNAQIRITEWMYTGTGEEFADDSQNPGTVSLSAFGTVQAGESVILTEATASSFRTNWNQEVQLLVDHGATDWYNTGQESKDLIEQHQKFCSEGVDFFRCDFNISVAAIIGPVCVGSPKNFSPSVTLPPGTSLETYSYKVVGGSGQGTVSLTNGPQSPDAIFEGLQAGRVELRLIVTDQNGCQDSADFTVVVNLLSVDAILSVAPVCVGESAPVIRNIKSFSSSPASLLYIYEVYGGTGQATINQPFIFNPSAGVLTGTSAGSIEARLIILDGNGCRDTTEFSATVNDLAISGTIPAGPVCVGATEAFTPAVIATSTPNPASVSYAYEITGGLGQASFDQPNPASTNASITGLAAGSVEARLIAIDANTCSDTIDFSATVNETPSIVATPPAYVGCIGSAFFLNRYVRDANGAANQFAFYTAPPAGQAPFQSVPATNGNIDRYDFVRVVPTATTTYWVVATSAFGCSDTAQFTIQVAMMQTLQVPGNLIALPGQTVNVPSFAPAGLTFIWQNSTTATGLSIFGYGNIAPFIAAQVTAPTTSTVTVYGVGAGCPTLPGQFSITVDPGAAPREAQFDAGLLVYPNPFQDHITLVRDDTQRQPYSIIDARGRTVQRGVIPNQGSTYRISTRGLSPGLYTLRVGARTEKVVKQ